MTSRDYLISRIFNILVLLIWIGLAVFFDKWWLSLISVFFMSFPKVIHSYYRVCDICGRHSRYANSNEEAIYMALSDGWEHNHQDNTDYCPHCKNSIK